MSENQTTTAADFIKRQISENRIVLFMKGDRYFPQCGFSSAVVDALDKMGVTYKDVNVLERDELRQGIKEFSDWPTIPQLYVGGEFIGGCDIIKEMEADGELEKLLKDGSQAESKSGN